MPQLNYDPLATAKSIASKKDAEYESRGIWGLKDKYRNAQGLLKSELRKRYPTSQEFYDSEKAKGTDSEEIKSAMGEYYNVFEDEVPKRQQGLYYMARLQMSMGHDEAQRYSDRNTEYFMDKRFNSGMYSFITDELTKESAEAVQSGDTEAIAHYQNLNKIVRNGGEDFTDLMRVLGQTQSAGQQNINVTASRDAEGRLKLDLVDAMGNVTNDPNIARINSFQAKSVFQDFEKVMFNNIMPSIINNSSSTDFGTLKKQLVGQLTKYGRAQSAGNPKFNYNQWLNTLIAGSGLKVKTEQEFEDKVINQFVNQIIDSNNNVGAQTSQSLNNYNNFIKGTLRTNLNAFMGMPADMSSSDREEFLLGKAHEAQKQGVNMSKKDQLTGWLVQQTVAGSQELKGLMDDENADIESYMRDMATEMIQDTGIANQIGSVYAGSLYGRQAKLEDSATDYANKLGIKNSKTRTFKLGNGNQGVSLGFNEYVSPRLLGNIGADVNVQRAYGFKVNEDGDALMVNDLRDPNSAVTVQEVQQKYTGDYSTAGIGVSAINLGTYKGDERYERMLTTYVEGRGTLSDRRRMQKELIETAGGYLKTVAKRDGKKTVDINQLMATLNDPNLLGVTALKTSRDIDTIRFSPISDETTRLNSSIAETSDSRARMNIDYSKVGENTEVEARATMLSLDELARGIEKYPELPDNARIPTASLDRRLNSATKSQYVYVSSGEEFGAEGGIVREAQKSVLARNGWSKKLDNTATRNAQGDLVIPETEKQNIRALTWNETRTHITHAVADLSNQYNSALIRSQNNEGDIAKQTLAINLYQSLENAVEDAWNVFGNSIAGDVVEINGDKYTLGAFNEMITEKNRIAEAERQAIYDAQPTLKYEDVSSIGNININR